MSFLKKLFGGGEKAGASGGAGDRKTVAELDYKGCHIAAQPYLEGGQYQVAGTITKSFDGVEKSHRFVRADRFPDAAGAADMTLMKARQIIDQNGDRIFN